MINLNQELQSHHYREIEVPLEDIFPRLQRQQLQSTSEKLRNQNPHITILNVVQELWKGGYEKILQNYGFHDPAYTSFSGHCHQCTPALGLVLHMLGFSASYLECYRVRNHVRESGILEKVPPQEEPNPAVRDEFCSLGRIPYCCLEVIVDQKSYYLTGKHLRPEDGQLKALLVPSCYTDFQGILRHQDDPSRSGIYLKRIIPAQNPPRHAKKTVPAQNRAQNKNPNRPEGRGIFNVSDTPSVDGELMQNNPTTASSGVSETNDFSRQVLWQKQTYSDFDPEYFATFLRMKLV